VTAIVVTADNGRSAAADELVINLARVHADEFLAADDVPIPQTLLFRADELIE